MKELTRIDCADWLLDHDRILILTHRRPDGDTVGSSAALCRGLRQMGKQAWILENPELVLSLLPMESLMSSMIAFLVIFLIFVVACRMFSCGF